MSYRVADMTHYCFILLFLEKRCVYITRVFFVVFVVVVLFVDFTKGT